MHDNDNPDNISLKNPNYCELTALYAMWKNCDADIQGLCHYRRYFSSIDEPNERFFSINRYSQHIFSQIIPQNEIVNALMNHDIILPFPFPPYPLNAFEDLQRFCYWKDIHTMYDVIQENYGDYLPAFESVMNSNHASYCNMFISAREFVNDYCTWLFDVLSKIEARTSLEGYDNQKARVYGYLAEVLLNVYIVKNRLKCKYLYMTFLNEKNGTIPKIKNWLKQSAVLVNIIRAIRHTDTIYAKNFETMKNFLSGMSDSQTVKLSGIEDIKRSMESLRFKEVEVCNSGNYSYVHGRLGYPTDDALIIAFMFKHEISEHNLNETIRIIQTTANTYQNSENIPVISRIALRSQTPETIKQAFIESGVSVIEFN